MEYNEQNNIVMQEEFQACEQVQKMSKNKQVYKDTITLIKLKMSKADTLIRQYNDKMKECDLLNKELVIVKNDKEDALKKYNQTMEKLTRIELSNSNYKESLETLKSLSENQKIKLDENEKHINQLLFKIKEMEQQLAILEEDNKTLEQEIKSAKASVKIATKKAVQTKHQSSQTLVLKTQEISVNTDPIITPSTKKHKMQDKSTITDKISCGIKEPFPIFCSKCDVLIEPAPVDQILKIMSCNPPLLSECHSPPNSLNVITPSAQVFDSTEPAPFNVTKNDEKDLVPIILKEKICKSSDNVSKEVEHSFMKIDSLNRKISKLENIVKKIKKYKRKKDHNCCHQNCCSSKKNIKFIVQLPNQEEIFEYRKRKKRKQQNYRLSKRRLNMLKRQNGSSNKWKIENCLELKKKRKLSSTDLQAEKRLKMNKLLKEKQNSLFEYENVLFSNGELTENYNCSAKSLSHSNLESHHDSLSSDESMEMDVNVTEKLTRGLNINQLDMKSNFESSTPGSSQTSVCNDISIHKYSKNLEKENNNLTEINSIISKTNSNSDCNTDLRIKNKETNGQLATINDEENVETNLITQLPNKISSIATSICVEENKIFFTQHTTELVEQCSDPEDKLLLNTKCINDNFTCSSNVEESQKCSANVNHQNIFFDQLTYGTATSYKQTGKNSENRNVNVVEMGNSQLLSTENIKLKAIDEEKKDQSTFFTDIPTDLPVIEKSPQKMYTCLEIPVSTDSSIQSANKELITNNCLPDLQIENIEQDILTNAIEPNNDNAIVSEESSEEYTQSASISKCRILNKTAKKCSKITQKKKLLTIIRNIKKSSKRPISVHKLESSIPQIIDKSLVESLDNSKSMARPSKEETSNIENISIGLPTKKQRIAHIPKSSISVDDKLKINSINENCESKVNIEKSRKTSVVSEKQAEKSNDKISSLLEDYNKTCKERVKIEKSLITLDPTTLDFSLLSDVNKYVTKGEVDKNKTKVSVNKDYNFETKDCNLRDLSQDLKSSESQKSYILNNNSTDNTKETSFTEKCNELENNKLINEQEREITVLKNEETNPTMELRSRQVIVNKDSSSSKVKKLIKYQSCSKDINAKNACLTDSIIVTSLHNFIANFNSTSTTKQKKTDAKENKSNEKIIEEQLDLLMQAEWSTDVNSKTVENLLDYLDIKTLALFLIEFVCEKIVESEEFDKSHTPPAPIMTPSEQKVVTLILSVNKIHRDFVDIIIEGIRYKLFKLGKPQMVQVVERLFRILVVLNKIKKDREKVRIFLCDALYCLNIRAINMIYVALTCWAEVLPKYSSNNDILVKTIVHIIMTLQVNKPFPKLSSLRKLLSTYYEYPNSGFKTIILKDELLEKLQENAAGVNTAILLLCKKMGPAWSMENIIKGGLKQMIVTQIHPSLYEALSLLGNILRSFPKTDSSNNVSEIIDQLCDILASNAGSEDLQEGVLSCLLSISTYKYEQIARFVIKWQSNKKDLRVATKEKLNSFFKSQGVKWWTKYINTNFPFSKTDL